MDLITALLGAVFVVFCSLAYLIFQRQKRSSRSNTSGKTPTQLLDDAASTIDNFARNDAAQRGQRTAVADDAGNEERGGNRPTGARNAARARLRAAAQQRLERETQQQAQQIDHNDNDDDDDNDGIDYTSNAIPTGGRNLNLRRNNNDAGNNNNNNHRRRGSRSTANDNDDDEDVPDIADIPEFDKDGKRIGTKKRKKMEAKLERRSMLDAELQMREERKRTQDEREERKRREEERAEAEEKKRLDEERRIREEKEHREHEEYLKLKTAFEIEDEGQDESAATDDAAAGLNEFLSYIENMKVVPVEDLAAHFKLKVPECISRIEQLSEAGTLTGVLDERGKFIHITQAELDAVASFLREKGRVKINELVEHSNRLINLEPSAAAAAGGVNKRAEVVTR